MTQSGGNSSRIGNSPSGWTPHGDYWAADAMFWEDLETNLARYPGRWVAYTPQGLHTVGRAGEDDRALERRCQRQGLELGHFMVSRVIPDQPVAEVSDNWHARGE
jgi:hypothetical protein